MTDFLITTDYLIHIMEFSLDFINHSYTLWFITALVMFCFELKKKKKSCSSYINTAPSALKDQFPISCSPHLFLTPVCPTFLQVTVSLWERTMCSGSTTQNRPELKERRRQLPKPPWSRWIGRLLRESFWRSRESTWSRRWRNGVQSILLFIFKIFKYGL